MAFGGKTIAHADLEVLLGAVPQELVQGLIAAVLAQDSPAALTVVAHLLDQGHDLKAFCADVVEYLRNLLVASVVPAATDLRGLIEASDEDIHQLAEKANKLTPEQLQELLSSSRKPRIPFALPPTPALYWRQRRFVRPASCGNRNPGRKRRRLRPPLRQEPNPSQRSRPEGRRRRPSKIAHLRQPPRG